MTAKELGQAIGKHGKAAFQTTSGVLYVNVTVLDVRKTFNRIDYQIAPEAGRGLVWIESSRVTLDDVVETF